MSSDTEAKDPAVVQKTHSHLIPAYMGAIMRRQFLQELVKNLPQSIQNRLTVLKNIQLDHLKIEAEFFEEVYKLEKKYQQKYQPLFDKRKEIITGAKEPEKEEPKWKEEKSEVTEKPQAIENIKSEISELSEDVKGIPNFWLTIFQNTEILAEMVQDHDEPVLRKLTDIKVVYDAESALQHSYTLEFHFDKNEYFSNSVLTKKYYLKSNVDEDYPFSFEGPEIFKCEGCDINWEKKMNLTVKTIRKKQKHKERAAVRTIVKQVPNDSFFNFFNPPEVAENKAEIDEESQGILATDFEIGHFLRARIVPKAVLYYTGDVIDDEDDDDEDDEYDGEDDEEDDESDNENEKVKKVDIKKGNNPNDCPTH